jgi:hypothetical protein
MSLIKENLSTIQYLQKLTYITTNFKTYLERENNIKITSSVTVCIVRELDRQK